MADQHRRRHQQPVADDCTRPVDHHVEAFADGARQDNTAHHELTDNDGTDNNVSRASYAAYGDNTACRNASAYGDNAACRNAAAYNNASVIRDATSYGHARARGSRAAY